MSAPTYAPGTPMGPPPTVPQKIADPDTPTDDSGGRALRKRPAAGAFASQSSRSHDEDDDEYNDFDDDDDDMPSLSAKGRISKAQERANRPFMFAPKLKLKVNDANDKRKQSFLGPYDRELDSDDEDLVFEEQFLLQMPSGDDCDKLRNVIQKRGSAPDVWFKFKDSRRAVFHIGGKLRTAKLVDLPCILESQKTIDNKHMFKVADICQMLVVEDNIIPNEDAALANKKAFSTNEFIWPHGLTPPLKHVRKRRFRKRLNRQAIENVENEVERLLRLDKLSEFVEEPIIIENADPNAPDSEFLDPVPEDENATPGGGSDGEKDNDDDLFAAELEDILQQGSDAEEEESEDDSGSDGDDGSGSGSDDDDDDDDEEYSGVMKAINDEIKHLEAAIKKKTNDIETVQNPALRTRFELARQKMLDDLNTRIAQKEQMLLERQAQRQEDDGEEESGSGSGSEEESDEEDEALDVPPILAQPVPLLPPIVDPVTGTYDPANDGDDLFDDEMEVV